MVTLSHFRMMCQKLCSGVQAVRALPRRCGYRFRLKVVLLASSFGLVAVLYRVDRAVDTTMFRVKTAP
jgi:hypothetical protein